MRDGGSGGGVVTVVRKRKGTDVCAVSSVGSRTTYRNHDGQ